jgi:TolB-like protein/Flp pilus assembly protein TadD/predicted Ser/Thr protein kinase
MIHLNPLSESRMAGDQRPIEDLAGAVVDGDLVNWADEVRNVRPSERGLVGHLQAVAAIAAAHRVGSSPTSPPDYWAHLHILEAVGHGACGVVYRAWDTRLDREVALKLVPAESPTRDARLSSIISEGRLLARVRHPNVVTIYGADQIGDQVGLWMEFIHGRTLGTLVHGGTRFTPLEVARIGQELARALAAVHRAGLLHRDIKAQNVMRSDDGRIVLMDFGAGREIEEKGSDLKGTPLFLAPEVLRGGPATTRSDLYGLGVVLYHLLTGAYPVPAKTIRALREAHQAGVRHSIQSVRPDLPFGLSRVVDRALDPRPESRYASAEELCADLEIFTSSRIRPWLGRAVAVILLVVVGGLVWQATPLRTDLAVFESPATLRSTATPIIAVLPFEDLGGEAENALVVEGLTAEIVRTLASIDGLAVRPAMAVFTRNGVSDIRDVGRQLGANLVLTGSILTSSGRLRVNVQLVRVTDGVAVWADAITWDRTDLFAAHDEVALAIVNRLRMQVGRGRRRYQIEPDVYYLFLKARGLQARRHIENAGKAAELFEAVLARERSYAPAWAGLASALGALTRAVPGEAPPPPDPRMEPAAREALRLDPLLAEAHAAIGMLHAQAREWERAEESFARALELDPSQTTIHTDFVLSVLLVQGKLDEGLRLLDAAVAVEPLSLDVRRIQALVQVDAGRYQEALESATWVLERDPGFPYADLWLGRALVFTGRAVEAVPIFARDPTSFGYLGYLYAVTGRREDAEALAAAHPESPSRQMLIYGGLGDAERTLDALEKTAADNWWRAATWMYRPELAVVRGHPRLTALRRKLGLPE